jgi:hypothetical protein
MGIACAHAKAAQKSTGCHCQKCRHQQSDHSRPADDSDDDHCCVCDGALAETSDCEVPHVELVPAFDRLVIESLPATHVVAFSDLPSRPARESGITMRIVLRSLVI